MRRTKVCKVCGKEYTVCRNETTYDGVFHWRVVACSPECGAKYLAAVTAARSGNATKDDSPVVESVAKVYKKPKKAAVEEVCFDTVADVVGEESEPDAEII